jgi:hypothetical protein
MMVDVAEDLVPAVAMIAEVDQRGSDAARAG